MRSSDHFQPALFPLWQKEVINLWQETYQTKLLFGSHLDYQSEANKLTIPRNYSGLDLLTILRLVPQTLKPTSSLFVFLSDSARYLKTEIRPQPNLDRFLKLLPPPNKRNNPEIAPFFLASINYQNLDPRLKQKYQTLLNQYWDKYWQTNTTLFFKESFFIKDQLWQNQLTQLADQILNQPKLNSILETFHQQQTNTAPLSFKKTDFTQWTQQLTTNLQPPNNSKKGFLNYLTKLQLLQNNPPEATVTYLLTQQKTYPLIKYQSQTYYFQFQLNQPQLIELSNQTKDFSPADYQLLKLNPQQKTYLLSQNEGSKLSLYLTLAQQLYQAKKFSQAKELWLICQTIAPPLSAPNYYLSRLAYHQNQLKVALELIDQALTKNKQNIFFQLKLNIQTKLNPQNITRQLELNQSWLQAIPNSTRALTNLISHYYQQNQPNSAHNYLTQLQKYDPDNLQAYYYQIQLNSTKEGFSQIKRQLNKSALKNKSQRAWYLKLEHLITQKTNPQLNLTNSLDKIQYHQQALPDTYRQQGNAYQSKGQIELAYRAWMNSLYYQPDQPYLQAKTRQTLLNQNLPGLNFKQELADHLKLKGQYQEAIYYYLQAWQTEPDNLWIQLSLSQTFNYLGEFELSEQVLQGINPRPKNEPLYYQQLSQALDGQQKTKLAKQIADRGAVNQKKQAKLKIAQQLNLEPLL